LTRDEANHLMLLVAYCALDVAFRDGLAEVPDLEP
jgi:hypothetical protein